MKQFFPCLLFLLLFALPAPGQDRLVSGVLTADDGAPLPGVNVVVKGTDQGTISDASGRYTLRAPLGATLVFSFIGFTPSEVVVTARNSSPVGGKAVPAAPAGTAREMHPAPPVPDTAINRRGVASLALASPGYVQQSGPNGAKVPAPGGVNRGVPQAYSIRFLPPGWATLRYGRAGKNGLFVVRDQPLTIRPFRVSFSSFWTLDRVNRLPARQNAFAQGRPVAGTPAWRGPATGEGFSWGPALNSLAYTGAPDAYDRNGPLTTVGNGNGNPAAAYAPYAFFRTALTAEQALTVSRQVGETRVSVGAGWKDQQYIIPGPGLYRN
ncbi:MAG TPA: carboxypeptidase-like regulatory domain-containing protein, partial [Cytophagales bacterium]